MCRHRYSCFENVIRTFYKTVGIYLILRAGVHYVGNDKIFDLFSSVVKYFLPNVTTKVIGDIGKFIEV